MNGKFPNSEKVFSYRGDEYMAINNLELRDAVSRLKLYCSKLDKAKKVTINTNPENVNELLLCAVDENFGRSGEEIMTVTNVCGKHMKKIFNVDYLLKILYCIESTDMKLFFNESDQKPCFVQPIEDKPENDNFNFLISSCSI
jgi:DNA polymerase III sliding clamp (beta) subunit (PCNA family)